MLRALGSMYCSPDPGAEQRPLSHVIVVQRRCFCRQMHPMQKLIPMQRQRGIHVCAHRSKTAGPGGICQRSRLQGRNSICWQSGQLNQMQVFLVHRSEGSPYHCPKPEAGGIHHSCESRRITTGPDEICGKSGALDRETFISNSPRIAHASD